MSQEFREVLGAIAAELLAEAHNAEWLGRQSITLRIAPSALYQLAKRLEARVADLRTVADAVADGGAIGSFATEMEAVG